MQIRNDYTTFQNKSYHESHTHHITECLHKEQVKEPEGGGGMAPGNQNAGDKSVKYSRDGDIYQMSAYYGTEKTNTKKGMSLVKGLWDALGDEGTEDSHKVMSVLKVNLLSGIHGAAANIKTVFWHQILGRVQSVRTKIKINAGNALKRFGKDKDTFAALTDGQTPSRRRKSDTKEKNRNGQVTAQKKDENIPMKVLVHSHLMDSYSKHGEYCQLNDNLTYQKPGNKTKKKKEESSGIHY